ncbi:MAG TPA: peptidoglycan DD-metalloendopeptidase family protein [Vicinamibacterales bacterium]|nr:peptidoglycan DD-metalloendopeptidase family protein [Vicinamibacterales bacterium]
MIQSFAVRLGRGWRSAILVVLAGAVVTAQAQQPGADAEHTQALAARASDRLAALQKESDSLASQEQTLLVELRKLEVDRQIKAEELSGVQRSLAQTRQQLAGIAAHATALQAEVDRQRPDVEARLVRLYKMGGAGYWRLLLDVDDVRDLGRAYRTAAALGRLDRERLDAHRQTLAQLAAERTALEKKAKDTRRLQARAADARAAVDRALAARTALVDAIDQRRDLNAQMTGELQDAQRRLQASLTRLAAGGPATAVSLPLRAFQGAVPWPADGVVVSRFGRQPPNRFGTAVVHNGIELSLAEGRPVHAVHEGTVAYADPFTGYGNLVIIDHGDRTYSLYGHLGSVEVHRGDRVDPSTTIGLTGRNPAGNPSLYFELRVDGHAVDPLQWLKRP